MKRLLCRSFALFTLLASATIGACGVTRPEVHNVTSDRGSLGGLPEETASAPSLGADAAAPEPAVAGAEASTDLEASARRRVCHRDSDCVPASCCHPTSCVPRQQRPDCSAVSCTQECRPGTLDCGQGYCDCQAGRCAAVIGAVID